MYERKQKKWSNVKKEIRIKYKGEIKIWKRGKNSKGGLQKARQNTKKKDICKKINGREINISAIRQKNQKKKKQELMKWQNINIDDGKILIYLKSKQQFKKIL